MYPDDWRMSNATQRDVLIALAREGQLSVSELADRLDRHKTSISKATRDLRDRGLIDREEWADRGYPLALTEDGQHLCLIVIDVYRDAL
jgi:DNA-binding MarR family transcriptional regulator